MDILAESMKVEHHHFNKAKTRVQKKMETAAVVKLKKTIKHKVKDGESLFSIAYKYGTS